MARHYEIASTSSAETAALDFLELEAADDIPIKLDGCEITQSTEVGDAQEEMLVLAIRHSDTFSGAGGVTTTANPVDSNDAAYAGTTPETLNDTKASTLGTKRRGPWTFNVRMGFFYSWPADMAPDASGAFANRLCVELVAAPADAVTWAVVFSLREL